MGSFEFTVNKRNIEFIEDYSNTITKKAIDFRLKKKIPTNKKQNQNLLDNLKIISQNIL